MFLLVVLSLRLADFTLLTPSLVVIECYVPLVVLFSGLVPGLTLLTTSLVVIECYVLLVVLFSGLVSVSPHRDSASAARCQPRCFLISCIIVTSRAQAQCQTLSSPESTIGMS